jgi:hypothetical protein
MNTLLLILNLFWSVGLVLATVFLVRIHHGLQVGERNMRDCAKEESFDAKERERRIVRECCR